MRIGQRQGQRIGPLPLPGMREDVLLVDFDGHVVDETGEGTVQADGEPHAQRREAQGHHGFRRNIVEDGVRMEDEGVHGGVRNAERRDAVWQMLDRRSPCPGQRWHMLQVRGRQEAEGLLQEPGRHRLRGRF